MSHCAPEATQKQSSYSSPENFQGTLRSHWSAFL